MQKVQTCMEKTVVYKKILLVHATATGLFRAELNNCFTWMYSSIYKNGGGSVSLEAD